MSENTDIFAENQPRSPHSLSILAAAREYESAGWVLIPVDPSTKRPLLRGWQLPQNQGAIPDGWDGNIGIAHVASLTCAIDIDDLRRARNWLLLEHDISIDELLDAEDSVRIVSGRDNKAKLLYRLDEPLLRVSYSEDGQAVLDFRCMSSKGTTFQDVLPPSIHPDTKEPYRWGGRGDWRKLPPLPDELLAVWLALIERRGSRDAHDDSHVAPSTVRTGGEEWGEEVWREALSHIDPNCNYDQWITIGMAVHAKGLDFEVWDSWSSDGDSYPGSEVLRDKWASFEQGGGITAGTLYHIAVESGWEPPRGIRLTPEEMFPDEAGLADTIRDGPENDRSPFRIHFPVFTDANLLGVVLTQLAPKHKGVGLLQFYRGDFYRWTSSGWSIIEEQALRRRVYSVLFNVYLWTTPKKKKETDPDEAPAKLFFRDIPGVSLSAYVGRMVDGLRSSCLLATATEVPCWLDGKPFDRAGCIVVANGVLNLRTLELTPNSPRLFSPLRIAVDWEPGADCPLWCESVRAWFTDSSGIVDEEQVALFQEVLGYLLSTDTSAQKAFLLTGPARSGKGTTARVLGALMPEQIASATLGKFGTEFGLQAALGKRLVEVTDARNSIKDDMERAAEMILSITGEDRVQINRKYKDPIDAPLRAKIVIYTNVIPAFKDPAGVLPTRFVFLRYLQSFLGREDPTLFDRLRAELPGILRWGVTGFQRYLVFGQFAETPYSREMRDDLSRDTDPLGTWMGERLVFVKDSQTSKDLLCNDFIRWCDHHDIPKWMASEFHKQFKNRCREHGIREIKRRSGNDRERVYEGVRLIPGFYQEGKTQEEIWSANVFDDDDGLEASYAH